jgi:hypothetical protein
MFFLILAGIAVEGAFSFARPAGESPKNLLAVEIRSQGLACDDPRRAVRDAKQSKPDYDVWVLTCKNATYRVGRYPDLPAKIERLQ